MDFHAARRTEGAATHKKALDLGLSRPYNGFVRCSKAARRSRGSGHPGGAGTVSGQSPEMVGPQPKTDGVRGVAPNRAWRKGRFVAIEHLKDSLGREFGRPTHETTRPSMNYRRTESEG